MPFPGSLPYSVKRAKITATPTSVIFSWRNEDADEYNLWKFQKSIDGVIKDFVADVGQAS